MAKTALLIVTLLWQGHWFGGQAGTVTFQWPDAEKAPEAVVSWEVLHKETPLGNGRLRLKAGDKTGVLSITMPEVRVKTQVRFAYKVWSADGKQELASGEKGIVLYPKQPLAPWTESLGSKSLVVWDEDGGLPVTLKASGLPHVQVRGGGGLQMVAADIVLVGQDQIDGSIFSQAELLEQAKAGSSVVVFSQKAPTSLMESMMVRKPFPSKLEWRYEHQFLGQVPKETIGAMVASQEDQELRAVRVDTAAGAVVLAYWPPDRSAEAVSEMDSLVAIKPLGKGRVIYWQLPLGKWAEDPRSQMVLAGALDFLLLPVQPKVDGSGRTAGSPDGVPAVGKEK